MPDRIAIAKANQDLASIATWGGMQPAQLAAFWQLAQEQPTILSDLEVQYMSAPTELIESLEFTGRITQKATEGVAFTTSERGVLTASGVELNAVKIRCEVEVTGEFSEDNLMGQSVANYIRAKMAARWALDFQDLIVLGDTTSSDTLLKSFNGIIKQFETADLNVVDVSSSDISICDEVLWDAWLRLDKKYRTDKRNLRIYANDDVISNYKQWFGKRETSRGDFITENGVEIPTFNGIRFFDCTSIPDGYFLLTNRMNIKPGIWRRVKPYMTPWDPADYVLYGLHMRADVKLIETACGVLYEGLNTAAYTTA